MIKSFKNIASVGIITDIDPRALPENAWTDGVNVRFLDNGLEKSKGEAEIFTAPAVDPYWLMPYTGAAAYWIYPGLAKVYVTDGVTNTNITRQTTGADVDYSADPDVGWSGGIIGNIPIINNGIDDPQMWSPASTATKLQSLTWATGQTWISQGNTAAILRPFKQFLVALDTTESGTRYKQRVRWSHPADSGAVPSTWDETDTTKDAGYYDIQEGGGTLIDCLPLGDTNIIYKESSTIGMQYIGGQFVFRFYNISEDNGIFAARCVKPFFGKHFLVTKGDVVVHDGNTFESVIDNHRRKELFSLIDADNYRRTYVAPSYQNSEMWICYPTIGSAFPNKAMVWNYKDNTWTTKDLPQAKHIAYGVVDAGGADTWDTDSGTWNLDTARWDSASYNPSSLRNLIAGIDKFYLADETEQRDGVDMASRVERTGLDFGDPDRVKYIKRLWPRVETSGDITISVGSQMEPSDAVSWSDYTYSSGDSKVDVDVAGRFIAIKFSSNTNVTWTLNDFDVEYEFRGRF
jgi:hypothetical protein